MKYNPLGNTGLEVSAISLGTMTFGEQNTERQAHDQLSLARESGINLIDTAELYPAPASEATTGLSETFIGNWLQHQDRSKLIIASKVVGPAPKKWIGYLRGGPTLAPAQIEQALHGSLKRLRTDYIDLYQIHWPSRNTNYFGKLGYEYGKDKHDNPISETLETLATLQKQGKIRHIGVSNETPWGLHQYLHFAEVNNYPVIASVQNPYCLLNRSYEIGLAEFAHRLHKNYFYRYTTEAATRAIQQYVEIAKEYQLNPVSMALAFVNHQPFVSSSIIGATTLEQLKQNCDSINTEIPEDAMKKIQQVHSMCPNPCP